MEPSVSTSDKNFNKNRVIIWILWILFYLCLFEQLSIMKDTLDRMSTTGQEFPLQTFLGYFQPLWDATEFIWRHLLGKTVSYNLFENYVWGGFTYMAFIWSAILRLKVQGEFTYPKSPALQRGRYLLMACIIFFALTILYGLNRDEWVPYVQQHDWVINLAHKQQLSAGTYLIVYYLILVFTYFPHSKYHEGSVKFILKPKIVMYTFVCMNIDNFASFNWFPGPIDPHNVWLKGYEEIFQHKQTWTSSDKIFHFAMSSAAVIILLMYTYNPKKAISVAITIVVIWELFEISLNPKEASDSLLDMCFNVAAMLFASYIVGKYHLNDPEKIT